MSRIGDARKRIEILERTNIYLYNRVETLEKQYMAAAQMAGKEMEVRDMLAKEMSNHVLTANYASGLKDVIVKINEITSSTLGLGEE